MMKQNAIVASLVAACAGVLLLALYKTRFENETRGGPPVALLVALADIPMGSTIDVSKLGEKLVPSNYVDTRQVPVSARDRVTGVRVTGSIHAGETLMWSDLATASDARRDLSSLVRPGMRGVTIPATMESSFGGLIRPGDRVDVLLSFMPTSATVERAAAVTIPLLQNILVLAAGENTGSTAGARAQSRTVQINNVTVSATVEQAQLLTFAAAHGSLTLTLRNPDDTITLDALPDTSASDIIEVERRRAVQRSTPTAPPAAAPTRPVQIH